MTDFKVKRILVPTDFSSCALEAMETAISLAQALQAQVFVLHVMEPPVYGLDFTVTRYEALTGVRQKLNELMKQCLKRFKKLGIEAEGDLITGVPFVEIIKAARQLQADLIIMGTHGRTGLAHVVLGSIAERVIQRAHCPVLTIKESKQAAPLPQTLKKEKVGNEKARPIKGDVTVAKAMTFCHICSLPSQEIICEACNIRVQAEALERKQRIEKEGRIESGRR